MNLLIAQFGIGPWEIILLFGSLVVGVIAMIPFTTYVVKKADPKNKKSQQSIAPPVIDSEQED